ncbi:hypothetical protein ACOMHN_003146 [Nucella lapillus]
MLCAGSGAVTEWCLAPSPAPAAPTSGYTLDSFGQIVICSLHHLNTPDLGHTCLSPSAGAEVSFNTASVLGIGYHSREPGSTGKQPNRGHGHPKPFTFFSLPSFPFFFFYLSLGVSRLLLAPDGPPPGSLAGGDVRPILPPRRAGTRIYAPCGSQQASGPRRDRSIPRPPDTQRYDPLPIREANQVRTGKCPRVLCCGVL